MALTPKQAYFVEEYLVDLNAKTRRSRPVSLRQRSHRPWMPRRANHSSVPNIVVNVRE